MSIKCQICNKEMNKQITNTHLKSHNMTVPEYKSLYGEHSTISSEHHAALSSKMTGKNNPNFQRYWSEDQKASLSKKKQGSIPWNKGMEMSEEQLEHLREGIKRREEKYNTGELVRKVPNPMTEEQKCILSIKQKEYAAANPEEMSERAKKATETKRLLGYDLAFFRNKKHSEETLELLRRAGGKANELRQNESLEKMIKNAELANCTVVKFEGKVIHLTCDTCKQHFTFTKQYFTDGKLKIECCPFCYPRQQTKRSTGETEIAEFIRSHGINISTNVRGLAGRKEVDIYLPDHNIAIEYNGLYWHSEHILNSNGHSKTKDNDKRLLLTKNGIRYIAIYEDEWINNREIVESRILHLIKKTSRILQARKCGVSLIDSATAANFCKENHIQGKARSNVRYGLFYNDELVAVMTFTKSNLSRKISGWELNRFCSKLNTSVVGGASRLLQAFIKDHNPDNIISYADNRWSEGNLYKMLGFVFSHTTSPNYWYSLPNEVRRIHRFALRKNKDDDPSKTEKQLRDEQGYLRIWDCGSSKWIWKRAE